MVVVATKDEEDFPMMRIKLALIAAFLVIATDGFAKPTDRAVYHKIWDRNVTADLLKPKVGCICFSQGQGHLGALVYPDPGTADTVLCVVPLFDPDGNVLTVAGCTDGFSVLPK